MVLPSWLRALQSVLGKTARIPTSRYVTLATVTPEGLPRCRTVVFRGFLHEDSCASALMFCTDMRTDKVVDIRNNPHAEICWYFQETREQFRIRGTIQLVQEEELNEELRTARTNLWDECNENIRCGFLGPPPGSAISTTDKPELKVNAESLHNPIPPETFCVLILNPTKVDWVDLKPDFQRIFYSRELMPSGDLEWIEQTVNP